MKTKILALLFLANLAIISCSKTEEAPKVEPAAPTCAITTSLNVTQLTNSLKIDITTSSTALFYEVGVLATNSGTTDPNNSQRVVLNTASETKLISFFQSIGPGTSYLFFSRAICPDGLFGAWSAPKNVLINDYCNSVTNIRKEVFSLNDIRIYWDSSESRASYYQVEYGIQGFALGNGTLRNTNDKFLSNIPLSANTTYDFYVRSYCTTALGWSTWVGPYTYLSTNNQFLCTIPTNVNYTVQRNSSNQAVGANFTWDNNGENNFEYTIVSPTASPNTGVINTIGIFSTPTYFLTQNTNYKFYVRAVCAGGTRTAWSIAKSVNIGY